MSASNVTPTEFDDFGITPQVQDAFARAAAAVRDAITAAQTALQATSEGSDAEGRASEALSQLGQALYFLEWAPPGEH